MKSNIETNWENNINKMTSNYNWGLVLFCFRSIVLFSLALFPSFGKMIICCTLLLQDVLQFFLSSVLLLRVFWHLSPSAHFRLKWKWNQQGNWGRFRDIYKECGIERARERPGSNVKWREITGKFSSGFWNVDNVAAGIHSVYNTHTHYTLNHLRDQQQ